VSLPSPRMQVEKLPRSVKLTEGYSLSSDGRVVAVFADESTAHLYARVWRIFGTLATLRDAMVAALEVRAARELSPDDVRPLQEALRAADALMDEVELATTPMGPAQGNA
jgi:hypothetical protein